MDTFRNVAAGFLGAVGGVILWLVCWTSTVLIDCALFTKVAFFNSRLDLQGGEYGPALPFGYLWLCGMAVGLPAFGVLWSVGAVRRWRLVGMLLGAVLGILVGGVGGFLAAAVNQWDTSSVLVVLGPLAAAFGTAGAALFRR